MATKQIKPLNGYDPSTPLNDHMREIFLHEVIRQMGNKAKAWAIVYNEGKPIPREKANYPYVAFKGEQTKARYRYLVDQQLDHLGIDTRHLLLKSSKLVDEAVKKKDINGFSTIVNTILKLKGEDIVRVAAVTKEVKLAEGDIEDLKGIFEKLD